MRRLRRRIIFPLFEYKRNVISNGTQWNEKSRHYYLFDDFNRGLEMTDILRKNGVCGHSEHNAVRNGK